MADLKIGADEMSAVKVVVKSFIDAYEDGSIEIENDTKELSNREFIGLVMSAYMKISYSLSLCETEDETENKKGE
jgi:hypothetical protein